MKNIKVLTIVLAIVLVTIVAFIGVYIPVQNRMENKVKKYAYLMDFDGGRNIVLSVDEGSKTIIKDSEGKKVDDADNLSDQELAEKGYVREEVKYNNEDILTADSFKKSGDIIKKRLNELKVNEYKIKQNEENGKIVIEIPEDDNTDSIVSELAQVGKFEIVDTETKEVLINNDDIKLVNVMYGSGNSTTTSAGTTVYLNIEFTKDGAKKLEDVSNKYVKVETTNDEQEENDNEEEEEDGSNQEDTNNESEKEKKVSLMIDDDELFSTSFEEPIKTGKMQLSVGQASQDSKDLKEHVSQASSMASILNNGKMPIKYKVDDNKYIKSDITNKEMDIVIYIILLLVCVGLVFLIFKYKFIGIIGTVSYIGLISLLLIVLRYTNVELSIQGILGIIVTFVLNYIFIYNLTKKISDKKLNQYTINDKIKDIYKAFFIRVLPICIATIVFCFSGWAPISSAGMVMFWGITLIAIYNAIITNILFKISANK